MPDYKQKNLINALKSRIQDKLQNAVKETKSVISYLEINICQFKTKVGELLDARDEDVYSAYETLNHELGNYIDKFVFVKAFLEITDDISDVSSVTDISELKDSDVGLSHDNSQPENEKSEHLCQNIVNFPLNDAFKGPTEHTIVNSSSTGTVAKDISVSSLNVKRSDAVVESSTSNRIESVVQNNFLLSSAENIIIKNEFSFKCKTGSEKSSLGSHYQSLSSNFSDAFSEATSNYVEGYNDKRMKSVYVNNEKSVKAPNCQVSSGSLYVSESIITVPSVFSAILTYIEDPGSFWIQLRNGCVSSFPHDEYVQKPPLKSIKSGDYCLAPFQTSPYYYRAKALNDAEFGSAAVKVFFIDHGAVQTFPLSYLRLLPWPEYDVPFKAIHCYLFGISPDGTNWSSDCIQQFKEYENHYIEATVMCKKVDRYGVQLISKEPEMTCGDFSIDIAYMLCSDGFATKNEIECLQYNYSKTSTDASFPNVPSVQNEEKSSCDSGVGVTFPQNSSHHIVEKEFLCDSGSGLDFSSVNQSASKTCVTKEERSECVSSHDLNFGTIDLMTFESCEEIETPNAQKTDAKFADQCHSVENTFSLDVAVSSPKLAFVKKNMMLVMVSYIFSPDEFYVNFAMETILNFDELREQMTSTYESLPASVPSLNVANVKEGMFCAARYLDGSWNRVKILQKISDKVKGIKVLVQYIDYGNKAVMDCSDLYPLTTQFAKYPVFAIKCCLAGVMPLNSKNAQQSFKHLYHWDEKAVEAFKQLIQCEKVLTAQIFEETHDTVSTTLEVLLWDKDTKGSEDILINSALSECGVALFDQSVLQKCFPKSNGTEVEEEETDPLNKWDPMAEEFYSIENSYGVDTDDVEVATTGYKAKDGDYVCKYYSLRGRCPRGTACEYEHVSLAEGGITRDQEEVYSFNSTPWIPEISTHVIVEVSAASSPGHFYVILPFGVKTVDEIDYKIKKGTTYNKLINKDWSGLVTDMSKYYSSAPFDENTTIALACGNIVAAYYEGKWYRGRVVDIVDITEPAEVFFVDIGIKEWIPRKYIRKILPQFVKVPFQAIECSLSGIEPVGSSWTRDANEFFKSLVCNEILLAEINERFGDKLYLSLRKTKRDDRQRINDILVSNYFAKYSTQGSHRNETIYVPG